MGLMRNGVPLRGPGGGSAGSVYVAPPGGGGGGGDLLSASDFTYIGSFKLQHADLEYGGLGMGWRPNGNSGSGSLLIAGNVSNYRNTIVEMIPATPVISATRTAADLNNATYVQTISDPTNGLITAAGGAMYLRGVSAITLPDDSEKFVFGFSKYFNSGLTNQYGLGYCDPNGSNTKGGWRLSGVGTQRVASNMSVVPQAWADANTGGRAIVSGGIDYQIMGASAGGHSAFFWAPWVDDAVDYAPSANSELSVEIGADYAMGEYANPSGQQMEYPLGVQTAGWKPTDHNFFWTSDSHGGCQYVVTSDGRAGFVVPGAVAGLFSSYYLADDLWTPALNSNDTFFPHGVWAENTQMYYAAAVSPAHGQVAGQFRCGLFLYDPADYLAVMASTKNQYDVTAYDWVNAYDTLSLSGTVGVSDGGVGANAHINWPNNNWNWKGDWRFTGSAYDPITRKLYVLQEQFYSNGVASFPAVHVWQVG